MILANILTALRPKSSYPILRSSHHGQVAQLLGGLYTTRNNNTAEERGEENEPRRQNQQMCQIPIAPLAPFIWRTRDMARPVPEWFLGDTNKKKCLFAASPINGEIAQSERIPT